jgi:hypothetical protein
LKKALLISPYFIPSNLAGVQRTRLMAGSLREFAWEPVIVTVDPAQFEEQCDTASLALLPKDLRIERVGAMPAAICRPLGFGDVSLRAQWTMRRRVAEIIRREKVDLIFATVLPGYTSLVGAWAKRKFGLPFVLDYQDPWVSARDKGQPRFSKAGLAHWLAMRLEPGVVSCADALTAVSDDTLGTLRERGLILKGLPTETIPIGADAGDHAAAARAGQSWIQGVAGSPLPADGAHGVTRPTEEFQLAYIGTIIESMLPSVRALFRAVRSLLDAKPARRPQIHFIGTSAQPEGRDAHGLERIAGELGVGEVFRLEPRRIGYLDALRSMQDADALLLLGSREAHYTASKIFPCWLSGKPVFALFHAASTVNELARELGGIRVVTYVATNGAESKVDEVAATLRELMESGLAALKRRDESAFEPYSARGVARKYAALFDRMVNAGNQK